MAGRIISFPQQRGLTKQTAAPNVQLLKAAKAAHAALLLAVPHGEKNTIVRKLGEAIRAAESHPEPPAPAGAIAS